MESSSCLSKKGAKYKKLQYFIVCINIEITEIMSTMKY